MPKICDLIKEGAGKLREAAIEDPRLTASLLLAELLGRDRTYLLAHDCDEVSEEILLSYRAAIERRAGGEPLQYITGRQEFYGRDFIVTPATLIPRPETELIVETALRLATDLQLTAPRILDICTGSGCIAVTLAAELISSIVFAVDISMPALSVARRNAERHGMSERCRFFAGDLCCAVREDLSEDLKFDLCCANPPYVSREDRETLQFEVRMHEPEAALFADDGGLAVIRRIFEECPSIVKSGGYLLCEIGYGQERDALDAVDKRVWEIKETIKDLAGIPRTLVLRRSFQSLRAS